MTRNQLQKSSHIYHETRPVLPKIFKERAIEKGVWNEENQEIDGIPVIIDQPLPEPVSLPLKFFKPPTPLKNLESSYIFPCLGSVWPFQIGRTE